MVQTCTAMPNRWATSINSGVASGSSLGVGGRDLRRLRAELDRLAFEGPDQTRRARPGPCRCRDQGRAVRGTRAMRSSEKDPMQTRSSEPVRRMASASGSTASSLFGSMLTRTSGQVPRMSVEQRDGLATVDPRLLHLGPRQLADGARAVGDAVEPVVVERDEDAVGRGVHVGLEVSVPEVDGVLERGERVLRGLRRAAPVRERDGPRVVEERERAHGAPTVASAGAHHPALAVPPDLRVLRLLGGNSAGLRRRRLRPSAVAWPRMGSRSSTEVGRPASWASWPGRPSKPVER